MQKTTIKNKKLQYIENLIQQGEGQTLDFKFEVSDSKKIAKSLVAFANTDGGILLIGVKDNGAIVGVRSDEEYYMIQAAANMYCKPKISFSVKRFDVKKKAVLEIKIEKSNDKPHFAIDENNKWKSYIRINDQNIFANNIQIQVWQLENNRKPIKIKYTRKEELLLSYLDKYEEITFLKFCKLAEISRVEAEKLFIDFILLNIIEIIHTEKEIFYKLVC